MKSIKEKEEQQEEEGKLQYKQMIIVILLTVIMVFASLTLSFSAVTIISKSKNLNYNSIITRVKEKATHLDDNSGKDKDKDKDKNKDKDKDKNKDRDKNNDGYDDVTGEKIEDKDDNDDKDITEQDLVFNYVEDENNKNGINIINALPISDASGKKLVGEGNTFDFKIYFGKDTVGHYYEITALKSSDSTLQDKFAKVYLTSDQELETVYNNDNTVKTFNQYSNGSIDLTNDNEKILYHGIVTKEDVERGYKNFTLKMWVSNNAANNTAVYKKLFNVKINVYAK